MQDYSTLQALISEALEKESFTQEPVELYEPIAYILSLGGKRIRPLLTLMACDLFGGAVEKALTPALAVETFHNFTLMHDDIMDAAPLRRGKATVHEKWNTTIALLSGDAMLVKSYQYLARVDASILNPVLDIFNDTALKVCEGQQYDMNFEQQEHVSIEAYLKMIEYKTAVLLAGALEIGAWVGGATKDDAKELYRFGKNLGIAFQLKDDLLDAFGDPEKFGKQVGGDIIAHKKTWLLLKAKELATGETAQALSHCFSSQSLDPTEKVSTVKRIYQELDIPQFVEEEIERFYQTAMTHLKAITVEEQRKEKLEKLAHNLMQRDY